MIRCVIALLLRHTAALWMALAALALALPLLQSPGSLYTAYDRSAFGQELATALLLVVGAAALATLFERVLPSRAAAMVRGSVLAAQILGLLHIARTAWINVPGTPREAKIAIAAAGVLMAWTLALRLDATRLRRLSEALVLITVLAFVLHPGFLRYAFDRAPPHVAAPSATPVAAMMGQINRPRPVVFVILDELDAELAVREGFFQEPPMRALVDRGALSLQMQPGGPNTLRSIPTMLTGSRLGSLSGSGPGYLLTHDGERWDIHSAGLFQDLDAVGTRYAVVGYYHDYCRIAPYPVSCFAQPVNSFSGWVTSVTRTIRAKTDYQDAYSGFLQQWSGIVSHLTDEALEAVSRRHADFLFVHLNLPHPPVAGGQRPRSLREDYVANLRLSAAFVDRMDTALRRIGDDYVLVVTSDHWLRETELWQDLYTAQLGAASASAGKSQGQHEVPLLVSFGGAASGSGVKLGVTDATDIRQLLLELSSRKVNTPAEVAAWMSSRPRPR